MAETMHESICAVVFDLDGLMFDTEALYFRVAGEMLAARGKTFTPAMMGIMIGRRAAEVTADLIAMAGLNDSVDDVLTETRTRFYSLMDTAVHPTPGLFALLNHLKTARLPIALATSSRRAYAERLLTSHGLLGRFAFLLTAEDVSRGKPDPEIYTLAATRFGVPPQSVMVLEDSPAGVAAAKAAGAFTVAVPHEHSPAAGLGAADLIASRLDDPGILAIVERAQNTS